MNSDEFNKMAVDAGFEMVLCLDGNRRLASPLDHDVVQDELVALKKLLLDVFAKKACLLIKYQTRFGAELDPLDASYNQAIADVIEIIEAMR